jgi:GNAT superfamily N-acetyltransferase
LHTKHRHFANSSADACRYPADVAPFAAVNPPSADVPMPSGSFTRFSLPRESTWLIGEQYPRGPQLTCEETLQSFQMVFPPDLSAPSPTIEHRSTLQRERTTDGRSHHARVSRLFPRQDLRNGPALRRSLPGELIAMGGERLQLGGYSEINAVCTHPSFRGQGFAVSLVWHLVRNHRRDGLVPWLHVGCPIIARSNCISEWVPAGPQRHATSHISQDSPN